MKILSLWKRKANQCPICLKPSEYAEDAWIQEIVNEWSSPEGAEFSIQDHPHYKYHAYTLEEKAGDAWIDKQLQEGPWEIVKKANTILDVVNFIRYQLNHTEEYWRTSNAVAPYSEQIERAKRILQHPNLLSTYVGQWFGTWQSSSVLPKGAIKKKVPVIGNFLDIDWDKQNALYSRSMNVMIDPNNPNIGYAI